MWIIRALGRRFSAACWRSTAIKLVSSRSRIGIRRGILRDWDGRGSRFSSRRGIWILCSTSLRPQRSGATRTRIRQAARAIIGQRERRLSTRTACGSSIRRCQSSSEASRRVCDASPIMIIGLMRCAVRFSLTAWRICSSTAWESVRCWKSRLTCIRGWQWKISRMSRGRASACRDSTMYMTT